MRGLRFIWSFFRPGRMAIPLVVACSLAFSVLEGMAIGLLLPVIELLTGSTSSDSLLGQLGPAVASLVGRPFDLRLGLIAVTLLFIAKALFEFLAHYLSAKYTQEQRSRLISEIFESLGVVEWKYVLNKSTGSLLNVLLHEVGRVELFYSILFRKLSDLIYMLILLIGAFLASPTIAALSIVLLALTAGTILTLMPRLKALGRSIASANDSLADALTSYTSGIRALRIFRVLPSAASRVSAQATARGRLHTRSASIEAAFAVLAEVYFFVLILGLLYLSASRGWSFGEVGTVGIFMFRITRRVKDFKRLARLAELFPSLELVQRTRDELLSQSERPSAQLPARFDEALELRQVSFSYDETAEGAPGNLEGVDLEIASGEIMALCGRSGAGKSTLLTLIMGLRSCKEGAILLDGVPLDEVDRDSWLGTLGVVPEEAFLLDATLVENIIFMRQDVSLELALEAARQAHLDEFIASLPDGERTRIGSGGVRVSAGERQRICLARALAGQPRLLILDDATNAVDRHSEVLIHDSIRWLQREASVTTILTSHRASSLAEVDRIVILDEGRIVEQGTREELLAAPESRLYRLYGALQDPRDPRTALHDDRLATEHHDKMDGSGSR